MPKAVPASEAVVIGEVIRGPGYIPNETSAPRPAPQVVNVRRVPKAPPVASPQRLDVHLGDAVSLSVPVSPMAGLAVVAGGVLAYKFVLPKLLEALGVARAPRRRRRRIKLALPAGGK